MADPLAIALTDAERRIVLDILRRHVPGVEVWAFGSRVTGKVKPWSDLDLALIGDSPVPGAIMTELRAAFDDSDLPWKVDLLDWATTAETFRQRVRATHAPLARHAQGVSQDGVGLGWPIFPLRHFVDPNRAICYGIVQPGNPVANGIPIIRVNNFGSGGLNVADVLRVDKDVEAQYVRSRLQGGELLITLVGSVGQSALAPDALRGWNVARAVGVVPIKDQMIARWVKFFFTSSQAQDFFSQRANTTVQTTVNLRDLAELPIPAPPRPTMEHIVAVLAGLDDKIELNRRMNETLERQAQAIFRDWFVDFGPTRRKAAGATDAVAIMGGLTPDPARAAALAALFPTAFGNDGLPVGWNDGSLARLALVNSESWKASNHPAEVEYVDLSNTKWGVIESTARLAWEAAPSRARRIARKGDSIIGTVRPGNGSYAYIGKDGYTVSTGFAVLRAKLPIYVDAIYVAATAVDNIARLASLADAHGGAYPAVNPDVVAATPFPVVPDALLAAFSTFASPLREKIEQAKLENTTLAETRDYLLPRLMSGAVRVLPRDEAA